DTVLAGGPDHFCVRENEGARAAARDRVRGGGAHHHRVICLVSGSRAMDRLSIYTLPGTNAGSIDSRPAENQWTPAPEHRPLRPGSLSVFSRRAMYSYRDCPLAFALAQVSRRCPGNIDV